MTLKGTRPAFFTDDEIGYVESTLNQPLKKVAEELGCNVPRVSKIRRHIKNGIGGTVVLWTQEELDTLTSLAGRTLTAKQIAQELPGRSVRTVQKRLCDLGLKLGNIKKSSTDISDRPLIAKTCIGCGLLLPAQWFRFYERTDRGRKKAWASYCRKCESTKNKAYVGKEESIERWRKNTSEWNKRAQVISLPGAVNNGNEWTEKDHEILAMPEHTVLTKALMLGRTYIATKSAVQAGGYKSHRAVGDPEHDKWIINNPNIASVQAITLALQTSITDYAGTMPPPMWDD